MLENQGRFKLELILKKTSSDKHKKNPPGSGKARRFLEILDWLWKF